MAAIRRLSNLISSSLSSNKICNRGYAGAALALADYDDWELPLPVLQDTQGQRSGRGAQWVFLGSPGVGKWTYASRLAKLLDVPHISMGDLLRQESAMSTDFSKEFASVMKHGKLVSDDVIFSILSRRLEHGAEVGESGFILEGFPRTTIQAEVLDEAAEIDLVVNMKLREDALMMKCLGRRRCNECGRDFNVAHVDLECSPRGPRIYMPSLRPPASCVSKMVCRADDNADVVTERLRAFSDQIKPVEYHYCRQGKLLNFEVLGEIPQTWPRLLSALQLEENEAAWQQQLAI